MTNSGRALRACSRLWIQFPAQKSDTSTAVHINRMNTLYVYLFTFHYFITLYKIVTVSIV